MKPDKAMKNLKGRFSSGDIYPPEQTQITRNEFNAIKDELNRLEKLLNIYEEERKYLIPLNSQKEKG